MLYSQYYEEILYPLQDKVLKMLKDCDLPFYLTGGTAVSRGYFGHRYSDDLDFFVNGDSDFQGHIEKVLKRYGKEDTFRFYKFSYKQYLNSRAQKDDDHFEYIFVFPDFLNLLNLT